MKKILLIISLSLSSMNLYSAEQNIINNQIISSLDEIANNIRKYKQENPRATDEQLILTAKKLY